MTRYGKDTAKQFCFPLRHSDVMTHKKESSGHRFCCKLYLFSAWCGRKEGRGGRYLSSKPPFAVLHPPTRLLHLIHLLSFNLDSPTESLKHSTEPAAPISHFKNKAKHAPPWLRGSTVPHKPFLSHYCSCTTLSHCPRTQTTAGRNECQAGRDLCESLNM